VQLIALHPNVAFRDCEDCKAWVYDEETGEREKKGEEDIPRYKGIKPPCGYSQGCAKGTPEESRALTEQNMQAWQFIRECKSVGKFPDDPIVRRNASLVDYADRKIDLIQRRELADYIKALMIR
jgi:hypothetical protein